MLVLAHYTSTHIDRYWYSVLVVVLFSLKRKDQQKIFCVFEELDQCQVPLTKKKKKKKDNPHTSAISILNVKHMYSICISMNIYTSCAI